MAITDEADVAQQGRGAMDELIQEGSDLLAQLGPIIGPAVPREHVTAQPVPELLDGVEPGRIRGYPEDALIE